MAISPQRVDQWAYSIGFIEGGYDDTDCHAGYLVVFVTASLADLFVVWPSFVEL